MARALKNSEIDPTYLDFFGMTRPPFSQLPVASQIFHSEQYSLLMAHLASATKQADCLMVICGADGSGKTTLLNRYITSLNDETTFATFDETCPNGTEFYCAFLRQLGFHDISGKLQELRRITREFLIHRGKAQDPVLLIMDNAHLVSPTVLEQLRWIAETKVDDRRVLSVVLAGNSDLPRIMESPAMKSMKFRTHVDFNIRVYSKEETEDYVRHRLRLAGGVDAAKFSNEAHPLIYRFSGGIPSIINMLCNQVLTEACGQETRVITEDLIRTIADRNRLVPNVFKLEGRGRRKTDPDYTLETADRQGEERITARSAPVKAVGSDPGSNSDAAARLVGLQKQLATLEAKLATLEEEKKLAQTALGERDRNISALHEQLEQNARETAALSATAKEVGELKAQLLAKSQESEILSGAVQEIEDLRRQLSAKTHDVDALQKEQTATKQELRALAKAADTRDDLQQQLKAKTKELSKLAKQADEVQDLRKQLAEQAKHGEKLVIVTAELEDLREQLEAKSKDSAQLSSTAAEIDVLRKQLEAKIGDIEILNSAAIDSASEIENLNQALEEKASALADTEKQVKSMMRDVKKEQNASKKALASVSKAEKRIEKLDGAKIELRQTVSDLSAELELAKKTNGKLDTLEKEAAALREQITTQAGDLEARETRVTELETLLKVALDECEALRDTSSAPEDLLAVVAEKDTRIAILESELASYCHLNTTTQPALDEEPAEPSLDEPEEVEALIDDDAVDDSIIAGEFKVDTGILVTAIEVYKSGEVEQVVTIADMPSRIMIGRGDDSELHLDSKFVSRHHALLFSSHDGLYIEDLNSFNGTVVNSKKIVRCQLQRDDKVVVGDYQLRPR